ncbi:MAG: NAD(P)/FAD-dependent oxidoreductase [Thermodesulfobacteriota bacterium]
MSYDCLVIGAGLSGMTAAIVLAQKGYKTALLEKAPRIGPTLRGFKRQGLLFDTGFHYSGALNDGEPLDIFFRYLGLSKKMVKVPFDPEGFDVFRCLEPEFEFPFPYGHQRIIERLSEVFPGERKAISEYFQKVRKAYYSKPYINLQPSLQFSGLPIVSGPTLAEVLNRLTENRLLKGILSMHCLLHGVPPEKVPFLDHAVVAGSYYESVNGIEGGGSRLLQVFEERLSELGVESYCDSEIQEILIAPDRSLSGVRTASGVVLEGRQCIATVHPRCLLQIVPDQAFRPGYRKRLEALEDSCSAMIVFARLKRPSKLLEGANLFLLPHPEFPDPELELAVEKRLLFVSHACQGGEGAPQEGMIVICPFPHTGKGNGSSPFSHPDSPAYQSFKSNMCQRIIAHLQRTCPEFRDQVDVVDCSTPNTLKRFTNSPFGSLYGVKHQIDQVNPLPVTKLKGLFLAGQSIVAPGILGAMVSAFVACGAIIGHEDLRKDLRAWV